jgi:hypothetical protein
VYNGIHRGTGFYTGLSWVHYLWVHICRPPFGKMEMGFADNTSHKVVNMPIGQNPTPCKKCGGLPKVVFDGLYYIQCTSCKLRTRRTSYLLACAEQWTAPHVNKCGCGADFFTFTKIATRCDPCILLWNKKRYLKFREERIRSGYCCNCLRSKAQAGRSRCVPCAIKHSNYNKKRYHERKGI